MRFILAIVLALLTAATAHAQSTYAAQIHNAPGWEPSTTYTYSPGPPTAPFTRVVAGSGWTPSGGRSSGAPGRGWLELLTGKIAGGGTWNPGSALNAYQLTSVGTCTSAAVGSGPSGTDTEITDGTCTWKYVSRVDYISLTGWALDGAAIWSSGANYGYRDVVQTGPDSAVYQQTSAGCTSTVQPTGTATGFTTPDSCTWDYHGQIFYSSRSHPFPMERFDWDTFQGSIIGNTLTVVTPPVTRPLAVGQLLNAPGMAPGTRITAGSGTTWTLNIAFSTIATTTIFNALPIQGAIISNDLYVAQLWNDREYVSGSNGENAPIAIWNHNYHYDDAVQAGGLKIPSPANSATGFGFPITIEAAAGESFEDTFSANPKLPLAGYNANNGVAVHGSGGQPGLAFMDNVLALRGLQVKSDTSFATTMNPHRSCNVCVFEHSIFEGGVGAWSVTDCGAQCYHYDNLIVAHGIGGIILDYGGRIYNTTIVCPEQTCSVAVENTIDWITPFGSVLNGVAMFGFTHLVATNQRVPIGKCTWDCATWQGTNNATDVSTTDGNNYPATTFTGYTGWTMYAQNFATGRPECSYYSIKTGHLVAAACGIKNGLLPTTVFLSWPGDYRINPSSPLYGGGASYGAFNRCAAELNPPVPPPYGTWSGCTVQGDTPDIFGTSRPQGARYDIGAMEFIDGVVTPKSPIKAKAR